MILINICILFIYVGTKVVAYYDALYRTIRHVQCFQRIPKSGSTSRCSFCRKYRDNVLRSGLSRLLKQLAEGDSVKRCAIDSHVNLRYLTPVEKDERIRNLHAQVVKDRKKIDQLQSKLE